MRAAKLRVVKPSASYELMLPDDICEQSEGNVSSFWVQGGPLLLQLSSYLRAEGEQVPAETRLSERMVKHSEKWSTWKTNIYADPVVDQATAHFTDENGTVWIHAYLVWPHLTVYATISGPEELTRNQNNWAVQGLRSIRLVRH